MVYYYLENFSPKFHRDPENQLIRKHFKKLAEISVNLHPKSIKWYQKPEIKSLQRSDLKGAKKIFKA